MAVVQVVSDESPHLDEVQQLWRANSDTLGFYTKGAFSERAQKGQVLAAIENGKVVGYAIYYTDKRSLVRLSHLCVGESARGKGIARLLIDDLRDRTRMSRGIGLHCRRDFAAWNLWPRLGFHAVREKAGKNNDGSELTFFWIDYPQPSLFPFDSEIDEDRLTVAIDANISYDLDDPTRNGAEETQGIIADWIQPSIQLCVTQELFNEIQRLPESEKRKRRMAEARKYVCVECDTDDFHSANSLVQTMLGKPTTPQDESDQRHLARCIASKAEVFVTRDQPLLDIADSLYASTGLSLVRPSQLVAQVEELRNERDYQRDRLAGTAIQTKRISGDDAELVDAFVADSEKQRALRSYLNTILAHPDNFQCRCISSADGKLLAMYVVKLSADSTTVDVPLFRINRKVLQTRLAGSLARTLLANIVQGAIQQGSCTIRLTDTRLPSVVTDALVDRGFLPSNGGWIKFSIQGVVDLARLPHELDEVISSDDIACRSLDTLLEALQGAEFSLDVNGVVEVEHILWPCKIAGTAVSNYVVPIRPTWATDLFDAGLANRRLWGADAELALNPDSVYYRATKPRVLGEKGRILWYVSDDSTQGSKSIRACSQMTAVHVGSPKDVFTKFRRFGVYEWRHVLETANEKDGQVMAVEFTDTELFQNIIEWQEIQAVLRRHGKNSTFPSPYAISDDLFFEFYRLGTQT